MKEKALNYICLMRKANAIQIGENDTGTAIRSNQAKLVVLAADASDNARHRAEGFVHGRNVPLIVSPFTKNEISQAVGKNGCSMAAICDIGFADSFIRCLCAISPSSSKRNTNPPTSVRAWCARFASAYKSLCLRHKQRPS